MANPRSQLEKALALHRAGQTAAAIEAYRALLRAQPTQAEALYGLSFLWLQQSQHGEVVNLLQPLWRTNVLRPETALNLGMALRSTGQGSEAIAVLRSVVQAEPTLAEAHHQLGNALRAGGAIDEAQGHLRKATQLQPRNPTYWLNCGVALLDSGKAAEAIPCFREAIRLQPNHPAARNVLGVALTADGQLAAAEIELLAALRLQPVYSAAHDNLARVYRAQGRLPEAIDQFRAALKEKPDPNTHSNLLLSLNYSHQLSPSEIWEEHRQWGERYGAIRTSDKAREPVPIGDRRLRIGYVSPDFINHAVTYFIEPVIRHHDRGRVETFAYSNTPYTDAVTARLRNEVEHWRDIARMSDEQVTQAIRDDQIDVLIDLAGHTGRNRLLVFARQPAAVQMTWIGYPNTTGLPAIDWRITDAVCDPPGQTEAWHAEKLLRLPGPFLCYQPYADSPAVGPLPALARGSVTFGCFNNFAKITPEVTALWSRLLQRVPGTRLILKSRGLEDAGTRARIWANFKVNGVEPERLVLDGRLVGTHDHLALYNGVDIALDAFPYNGTTTTCEALWMGVPVVSLAGRTHVARVGASLLTHAGHSEWIAYSPQDYLEKAASLARDLAGLARVRSELRSQFASSPICDAAGFVRSFEQSVQQAVRSLREG